MDELSQGDGLEFNGSIGYPYIPLISDRWYGTWPFPYHIKKLEVVNFPALKIQVIQCYIRATFFIGNPGIKMDLYRSFHTNL